MPLIASQIDVRELYSRNKQRLADGLPSAISSPAISQTSTERSESTLPKAIYNSSVGGRRSSIAGRTMMKLALHLNMVPP